MKLYIARDADGTLCLYNGMAERDDDGAWYVKANENCDVIVLDRSMFPSIPCDHKEMIEVVLSIKNGK